MRCALGCERNGTPFHRFPNPKIFPEQFKAWVNVMGGKLENSESYLQYMHKRICGIHFRVEDRNRNNRLNALAVPSLHLPIWCNEPDVTTTSSMTKSIIEPDVAKTSSVALSVIVPGLVTTSTETHSTIKLSIRKENRSRSPIMFDSQNCDEDLTSHYFIRSRKSIIERDRKYKIQDECETQCENIEAAKVETISNREEECTECELIKENFGANQDKRNTSYSQLLNEELQLIQPCMRTRVYARMLNFLATIKNLHTSEIELTDSEKRN